MSMKKFNEMTEEELVDAIEAKLTRANGEINIRELAKGILALNLDMQMLGEIVNDMNGNTSEH